MLSDTGHDRAPRKRKARDAEATRNEIIRAAMDEFAEKGFYGARVEDIASRTKTSKHMIYYYFGSKAELYSTVLEHAYAEFRAAEHVDYDMLEPVEALKELIGNSFDTHVSHPHVVRIVMSENLAFGSHVRGFDHSEQRQLVLGTVSRILQRGSALGILRDDIDPLQFHMSVSALSFYFVSNRHTFGAIFDVDLDDKANIKRRRDEIIKTMLTRCVR